MTNQQEIETQLKRLEKYNDPVLLMMGFLTIPAVIMATIFSILGDGTLIKMTIAVIFLFFTWLAFFVSSMLKKRIEYLRSKLELSN